MFKEKTAVITGASSGIGRAIALALSEKGVRCFLVGRNKQRLDEVVNLTRKHSSLAIACTLDLTEDENVTALVEKLKEELGCVDILVHSSGIFAASSIDKASMEDFDQLYRANVRAPYLLTKLLLPLLRSQPGQIVFINSSQGLNAKAGSGQFASTQHSMKAIADSLREEVNPDGIRVMNLFLGRTATPRMASIYKKEGREYKPNLLLQPSDVASVVLNLLSLPPTAEVTNLSIRPMIKSY